MAIDLGDGQSRIPILGKCIKNCVTGGTWTACQKIKQIHVIFHDYIMTSNCALAVFLWQNRHTMALTMVISWIHISEVLSRRTLPSTAGFQCAETTGLTCWNAAHWKWTSLHTWDPPSWVRLCFSRGRLLELLQFCRSEDLPSSLCARFPKEN